jgi:hypothetical protein
MEELKKFTGKEIKVNTPEELEELLKKLSIKYSHLPESLEEFDELELVFDYTDEKDFYFCVTFFQKKIQRMMLIKVDKKEPENIEPPTEDEVKAFYEKYGEKVVEFLEKV